MRIMKPSVPVGDSWRGLCEQTTTACIAALYTAYETNGPDIPLGTFGRSYSQL